jgi:hypothetical protein
VGWRRRAGGGKRDTAEDPIVAALEAVGASVWKLGGTGNPDLLTLYRGVWRPMECKTGAAGVTKNQTALRWPIVRTPDEALRVIGAAHG